MIAHRKIRIVLFSDILIRNHDGAMRTVFHLLDGMHEQNVEYFIVTSKTKEKLQNFLLVPSLPVFFNSSYKIAIPWFVGGRLSRRLKEWKPELIHITSPSLLGSFALHFARNSKIPVITIYHTHFFSYIDYYFSKANFLIGPVRYVVKKWMQYFYNRCDEILVPSQAMLQQLMALGIQESKLTIWTRGVDTTVFHPEKRKFRAVQKFTKNSYPTIFYAGRLVWEKNLKLLAQIVKLSAQQKKKWNFVIAGDGPARIDLEKEIPEAFFTGALDHQTLSRYYASSDLFLMTSDTETFGNVVLEAMACGIPCVVANSGGHTSLITHGISGYLCDVNRTEDWISALNDLFENPGMRASMVKEANLSLQTYTWPALVEQYVSIAQKHSNQSTLI